MEEKIQHIETIYKKLQLLVKQYEALKKDNSKLKTSLTDGEVKFQDLLKTNEALQQENLVLKAGLQSMGEKDKKALEQKINSYLKSLDKTIALLSQ